MNDVITDAREILDVLKECLEDKCLIGVWATPLGSGFVTGYVESIRYGSAENDTVIILKEKTLQGRNLETQVVYLKEIKQIHRF